MTRKKYFVMIFMILLSFIFIKIYQHNLLIKLNYEKQRFDKKNNKLRKKKNELLVQYFKLKNPNTLGGFFMFDPITIAIILILIIFLGILIWIIMTFNTLIATQKQVDNSWAQIDVQLKRRADLIPNLIETVKGYAKFENKVLQEVNSNYLRGRGVSFKKPHSIAS